MSVTTDAEVRKTIYDALGDRADKFRKLAASRPWSGPAHAGHRAGMRAEAQRCLDLQRVLMYVNPRELAVTLGINRELPDPVHHGDVFSRIEASTAGELG